MSLPRKSEASSNSRGNGSAPPPVTPETDNIAASAFADLAEHELPNDEHDDKPASVFDNLDDHRVDLDDDDDVADDILTTVPVRRPGKHWVRVHPEHQFPAVILEDRDNDEVYYVMPAMRTLLTEDGEARRCTLVLCINRRGVLFWWPIPSQGTWRSTALIAAERAKSAWIKAIADKDLNGYRVKVARTDYGEPEWGEHTLSELLELTFPTSTHVIQSADHPMAKDV
jgi:hypothetical protein